MEKKILSSFIEKLKRSGEIESVSSSFLEIEEMIIPFIHPMNMIKEEEKVEVYTFNKSVYTKKIFFSERLREYFIFSGKKNIEDYICKKIVISIFDKIFTNENLNFSILPNKKLSVREIQQCLGISHFFNSETNYHLGKYYSHLWRRDKKEMENGDIVRVFNPGDFKEIVKVLLLFLTTRNIPLFVSCRKMLRSNIAPIK